MGCGGSKAKADEKPPSTTQPEPATPKDHAPATAASPEAAPEKSGETKTVERAPAGASAAAAADPNGDGEKPDVPAENKTPSPARRGTGSPEQQEGEQGTAGVNLLLTDSVSHNRAPNSSPATTMSTRTVPVNNLEWKVDANYDYFLTSFFNTGSATGGATNKTSLLISGSPSKFPWETDEKFGVVDDQTRKVACEPSVFGEKISLKRMAHDIVEQVSLCRDFIRAVPMLTQHMPDLSASLNRYDEDGNIVHSPRPGSLSPPRSILAALPNKNNANSPRGEKGSGRGGGVANRGGGKKARFAPIAEQPPSRSVQFLLPPLGLVDAVPRSVDKLNDTAREISKKSMEGG
mmetsp:Transcript_14578/g.36436  ORF Transcript_14578/g.36436 Transcript_14578/m.36436 type:complete len:348 (+) Transcript_14578:345-1388(+)|eukprot:CAMPEP_0178985320 /NCGR_PEP_ID=MMETSP0795-20121207/2083_1 /TAXON_ID=88552 /ORGANISM="Amoebophrya sp., Strain Ameob2" /LENGTH=347 /DNA_ID=CAMNT_0020676257 /DNA_START=335 /DNA_END=1378 /DNA_ORIENTATION=-